MFRDDSLALAEQNSQLQREVAALRAENAVMRDALQAYRIDVAHAYAQRSIYESRGVEMTEGDRVALSRHGLEHFPPWAAALLHVLTFGLWSIVHFGRAHARLPKLRPDDPTLGRAIGLFFVPYVNVWWMFFAPMRLVDRINFQFMLRRREAPLTKLPIVAGAVMSFFMYFLPVGWVFAVWKTQRAINDLVALGPVVPAVAAQPATGVRVDTEALFGRVPAPGFEAAEAAAPVADARAAAR